MAGDPPHRLINPIELRHKLRRTPKWSLHGIMSTLCIRSYTEGLAYHVELQGHLQKNLSPELMISKLLLSQLIHEGAD